MRFRLLGSTQVASAEGERPVPGVLRRTLLATLLLHHDTAVSADRLAEVLWGQRPPASPTTSLYNQVMRLRRSLGADADRVRQVAPGYLIHLEPGELDLESFEKLCAQGRRAADRRRWTEASAGYTAALDLWRGDPLADVPPLQGHAVVQRLHEERLQALLGRADAELHGGRHEAVVGELRALVEDHPLREEFHSRLMLALYRSGRGAEALDAYRSLRRVTVAELGVEPGPELRRLHTRILRSDPDLAVPTPPAAPAPPTPPAAQAASPTGPAQPAGHTSVRQLPADARIFIGRASELDELLGPAATALGTACGVGSGTDCAADRGVGSGTVVISAINGMGGVGKTALAVRAAHRLADRFPDGQLFIDLHGYSADLDPVEPAHALEYLLRSLGVPSTAIPVGVDERGALYRSRLAGTRTLIVLDNAVNAAQARPLLPASPGCLVLITSRNRLSSLDDAHLLALDVLPQPDAVALLREVAGQGRAAEDGPAAELVELCGRIPLAVRIAGSRLRHHSALTVESLIAELRVERSRLDRLSDGERDLTSLVGGTLKVLAHEVQRMFRLLGLAPGPDFDAYAAAHLAATGLASARRTLETLLDHNLLNQHAPGRYRFHDLLRVHARMLAEQDPDGPGALDRLLDFSIHTARAADRLVAPRKRPMIESTSEIPEPLRSFGDREDARAWLRAERPNLLAAIADGGIGQARRISLIAAVAADLGRDGPSDLAARLFESVVEFAQAQGDRRLEADALLEAAGASDRMGLFDRATRHATRALEISQEIGSRRDEARALSRLAHMHYIGGRYLRAGELSRQAHEAYEETGDHRGATLSLWWLGLYAHAMGRNATALEYHVRTIDNMRALGDTLGEADCLFTYSRVKYALGDFDAVLPMLEHVLSVYVERSHSVPISNVLQELGRHRLLRGEYDEAERLLGEALEMQLAVGFRIGEGNVYWERGRIAFARGDLDQAAGLHRRALGIFESIGVSLHVAMAWHELARIHHVRGELSDAADLLTGALDIYTGIHFVVGEAEVRNSLAALTVDTEGDEAGLAAFAECLALTSRAEHPLEQAHALEGMARCELRLGKRETGLEHLRAAVDLYARMSSAEHAAASAFLARAQAAQIT